MDISGSKYPETVKGKPSLPLYGHSLLPILNGEERPEPASFISRHTEKFRMYRKGDWKIVRLNNEDWELYNLKDDPTETANIAEAHPEKVNNLRNAYKRESQEMQSRLN